MRHPPRAAKAEHLQRAGLPWLRHKPDADDHHLDVTADEISDRRRCTTVMHRRELVAGHPLQQDDIEMSARSDAEGSVIELARPLPGEIDKIAERAHRQRWMDDERLWADAETGDRHEIVDRIIGQLAVDVR